MPIVTIQAPKVPRTVRKASMVSAEPTTSSPDASVMPSTPEEQIARPVMVQITMVSKKVPVMLI